PSVHGRSRGSWERLLEGEERDSLEIARPEDLLRLDHVAGQGAEVAPGALRRLGWLGVAGLAGEAAHHEKEVHGGAVAARGAARDAVHGCGGRGVLRIDLDADFLARLADSRRLRRLACLDVPGREAPETVAVPGVRAPQQEDPAVPD